MAMRFMMRPRAVWLASLLVALALGALLGGWFAGGRARIPPPAMLPGPPPAPEAPPSGGGPEAPFLQIEGTKLSGTDAAGRLIWEIRATTLEVDRPRERILMASVTGQFYGAGKPQLAFQAPSAVFHVPRREVELTGGVTARTTDGRTLRAARLRYSAADRMIVASGDVTLTQPGVMIRADELRTDPALAQQRFSGKIVVRVTE